MWQRLVCDKNKYKKPFVRHLQYCFMLLINSGSPTGDYRADFKSCLSDLICSRTCRCTAFKTFQFEKQSSADMSVKVYLFHHNITIRNSLIPTLSPKESGQKKRLPFLTAASFFWIKDIISSLPWLVFPPGFQQERHHLHDVS